MELAVCCVIGRASLCSMPWAMGGGSGHGGGVAGVGGTGGEGKGRRQHLRRPGKDRPPHPALPFPVGERLRSSACTAPSLRVFVSVPRGDSVVHP